MDCTPEEIRYRAVDLQNRVFDVYPDHGEEARKASEVFASIPGLYKLPESLISSVLDLGRNPGWQGGELETVLRNPFPHPVDIWMQAHSRKIGFSAEGLPDFPLRLEPGERRSYPVRWTPEAPFSEFPEGFELSFNVQLHRLDPSREKPLKYDGKVRVSIVQP